LESPLVGLPPASKMSNLVSLFCKPVGETKLLFCCGLIGNKKWTICLVPIGKCAVSRHATAKFDFPLSLRDDELVVFINAPSPKGTPPAMFSAPCIPASALSVPIDDWRGELLGVKDWQSWLNAMSSPAVHGGDTNVKMDLAKKKFDQLPPGKTPLKKLRYVLPSTPREDDWEGVFPTLDELSEGGSPNSVMDAIKAGWPIMVRNVEDTSSRLTATRDNIRIFQQSVSDDMAMWDFRLQDLTVFLGTHPVAFGTDSVWEALQDSSIENEQTSLSVTSLSRTVSDLSTQVSSFRSGWFVQGFALPTQIGRNNTKNHSDCFGARHGGTVELLVFLLEIHQAQESR
jgi:hypothetical protein